MTYDNTILTWHHCYTLWETGQPIRQRFTLHYMFYIALHYMF